jgi:predicted TIM-barrel fold metal-dependent hydrolase
MRIGRASAVAMTRGERVHRLALVLWCWACARLRAGPGVSRKEAAMAQSFAYLRSSFIRAAFVASMAVPALLAGDTAKVRSQRAPRPSTPYELNDSHFHLTNYAQTGVSLTDMLSMMGSRVGRVAVFGIPLQQKWSFANSGDYAPTYYLQSDAPLYYYSFTDAHIASAYLGLSPRDRDRFDPMITGFNPSDMYAVEHIRRVLAEFPGVFSGIGEFTIHKEFVSAKIADGPPSLTDPALDRILDLAAEVGLVALIHNDVDAPFAKSGSEPVYLEQVRALFERHPQTTIIWAHTGLGRVVRPLGSHAAMLQAILENPRFRHVYFDISWDELAKYVVSSPESVRISAVLINRFPDRFLFGTDEVAPANAQSYLRIDEMYAPLWRALSPDASRKVRKENYERLFDEARRKVRAWEAAHRAR